MTTLTLQVTEVRFDFDDLDFGPEEQQAVLDDVLGNVFEVEVDDGYDDEVVADALVEEVTDYAGWQQCQQNGRTSLHLKRGMTILRRGFGSITPKRVV